MGLGRDHLNNPDPPREKPMKKKAQRRPSREQEMAVGTERLLDSKYAEMLGGFQGVVMGMHPAHMLMALVGRSGRGKSSLLHSCPYAYVINADISSTPRRARASIWPGKRSDGRAVEFNAAHPNKPENGTAIDLTWRGVLEKKEVLIELAKEDVPGRPRLVALDRVDTAADMVRQYMIEEWNTSHPDNEKEEFDELPQSRWQDFYNHFLKLGTDLHRHGYGFCWVFGAGDKTVYLDERKKVYLQDVPLCMPNLYDAIIARCEMVMFVDIEDRVRKRTVKVKNADGTYKRDSKGKIRTKTKTDWIETCVMYTSPTDHNDAAKSRLFHFPDELELPRLDPWATFEQVAIDALAKEAKESDQ